MPVPLLCDYRIVVKKTGQSIRLYDRCTLTQPHGSAFVHRVELWHVYNEGMLKLCADLGGIGAGQASHIAGELDHGNLQP